MGDFDPSCFKDPIALRTEWSPSKKGGTSIELQRLQSCGIGCMNFVPSPVAQVMGWMFLLFGLGTIAAFGPFSLEDGIPTLNLYQNPLIALLIGLAFSVTGAWILRTAKMRNEFNTISGQFNQGKHPALRLSEVHALQLLGERCHQPNDPSFTSYELNLVLTSGRRVNIVDQGNLKRLRTDAQILADFLGKPLWDIAGE